MEEGLVSSGLFAFSMLGLLILKMEKPLMQTKVGLESLEIRHK